jgi:SAM-dependent methyltransferase
MTQTIDLHYYDRDFWGEENQRYSTSHFRLEKCARLVNRLAGSINCDLLDVGCGPGTLGRLLRPNIQYHGIDIALRNPGPTMIEIDITKEPIRFGDRRFDIVVAQGLWEYMGEHQDQKLSEIADLLAPHGIFVTSYVNFRHRETDVYEVYNNVQPPEQFRRSIAQHFAVQRCLPTSHRWHHSEPNRRILRLPNMYFNAKLPYVTPILAVEYLFVCRPLPDR